MNRSKVFVVTSLAWLSVLCLSNPSEAQQRMPQNSSQASVLSILAGALDQPGHLDAQGTHARFDRPFGLAVGPDGSLYVADMLNRLIRRVSLDGQVTTVLGDGSLVCASGIQSSDLRFYMPVELTFDSAGNMYVVDILNNKICAVKTDASVIEVGDLVGLTVGHRHRQYPAMPYQTTRLGSLSNGRPRGIVVDSFGNIFVTDYVKAVVWKISSEGQGSLFAGQLNQRGDGDGQGEQASFHWPTGIAIDSQDNLYITDIGNSTIRKITSSGVVTTIAGLAHETGHRDGQGSDARFFGPTDIVVDAQGNLYVTDTGNHTVRKITPSGMVTTVVGVAGEEGIILGPLPARLKNPRGLAIYQNTLFITGEHAVLQVSPLP